MEHEKKMGEKIAEIKDDIDAHTIKSERRHEELTKRFDTMSQSTMNLLQANNQTVKDVHKMFKSAFPEGDAESHRRAHEQMIEKDKAEREFWMHLKKQVVAWGITAALAWFGMLVWAGFLKGPGG